MALSRTNPLAIENLVQVPPTDLKDLFEVVKNADRAQTGWLQKQEELINLRFGPPATRSVPWADASNLNVPLIDSIIRRWRPSIVSQVIDANPVAYMHDPRGRNLEVANAAGQFFHWMVRDQINIDRELMKLVDAIAMHGHAYVRESWDYATDTQTRVVSADDLWPQGIEATLQAAAEAAAADGQELDPLNFVLTTLEEEYAMSRNTPDESETLLAAAQDLLTGEKYTNLEAEIIRKDQPGWHFLSPLRVITDPNTDDPSKSEHFTVIHELSTDQIMRMTRDGTFHLEAAREIVERIKKQNDNNTFEQSADGLRDRIKRVMDRRSEVDRNEGSRTARAVTRIFETFVTLDLDGDGVSERYVVWWAPEVADIVLGAYAYPFPFDSWPITLFVFEGHACRPWESRGIPELIYDLQILLNAQTNMRLDAGQIALAPVYTYRQTNGINYDDIAIRPGALIPVTRPDDVTPLIQDLRIIPTLLQEAQATQRTAEAYIGTFDATINQITNSNERRTAAEVNAITQLASNVFGLDARVFQMSMAQTFQKIWDLYREFGDATIYFRVMGENRTRTARKSEIGKLFDVKPAGSPTSTNRGAVLNNIERALPVVLQDQSGTFDRGALLEFWMQTLDPTLAERVIRAPEDRAAAQLVMRAGQIATAQQGGNPQDAPPV